MGLLRLAVVGSVDDGKSTLLGRLLWDTAHLPEDHRAALGGEADRAPLAWVTDGLRAERAQGITLDVAHRAFATRKRRYLLADAPGHAALTRNLVTAASRADAALLVIDATRGVGEGARRHALVASALGVRTLVACVNKMDLVGWSRDRFQELVGALRELPGVAPLEAVPLSALQGDGVARPSAASWYRGPTLLELLDTLKPVVPTTGTRLVLQLPLDDEGTRWGAQLVAGTLAPGAGLAAPDGARVVVEEIGVGPRALKRAEAPRALTLRFSGETEALGHGRLLHDPVHPPTVATRWIASAVWLAPTPPPAAPLLVVRPSARQAARLAPYAVFDAESGVWHDGPPRADHLVRLALTTAAPFAGDPYSECRATGSFLAVDPADHATLAAGWLERAV